jgi:hypothetical protein
MLFLASEWLLRLFRVDDVILYRKDAQVGYIPIANQTGRFFNRIRFVFNDRSMGVGEPFDLKPADVILIGDSIVNGGVQIDQPERLGPQLQAILERRVWPLSAASWALGNELKALYQIPDFNRAAAIVFVNNYDDFRTPSVWKNDIEHPARKPRLVSLYVLRKLLRRDDDRSTFNDAPSWQPQLRRLLAGPHPRIIFALHHVNGDQPTPGDPLSSFKTFLKGSGAEVCDLQGVLRPQDYRDFLHPLPSGNVRMAHRLSDCLQSPAKP